MFNPYRTVLDAFVTDCVGHYREAFPNRNLGHEEFLEQAARTAIETLLNCDCPYHDANHTMLVTDAGQTILRGRLISQGDISPQQWVHVTLALLFHDIGFVRGLLKGDGDGDYLADENGERITPPEGATDAFMMPYHVTRGRLYVGERFANEPLIDVATVASYIEMTRFPVPADPSYAGVTSLAGLVRAADLIGQMGDPLYGQKLARLFAELSETGEASRLGYANVGEMRRQFPTFFYNQVFPYITEGLRLLHKTQEGRQWEANLHNQVHNDTGWVAERGVEMPRFRPHIAVNNA